MLVWCRCWERWEETDQEEESRLILRMVEDLESSISGGHEGVISDGGSEARLALRDLHGG